MRFFEIDPEFDFPVISPELRQIVCFKELIALEKSTNRNKDNPNNKEQAKKWLAFIYFYASIGTPYKTSKEEEEDEIVKAVAVDVGLGEDFKIFPELQICIDKYKDLQKTKSFKVFEVADGVLDGLHEYLKDINFNEVVETGARKGELKHNPKTIMDIFNKLGETLSMYEKVKTMVENEVTQIEVKTRGNKGIHKYEDRGI
jgi:hypothetical protein